MSLTDVAGIALITNNPMLPECEAQRFFEQIPNGHGYSFGNRDQPCQ